MSDDADRTEARNPLPAGSDATEKEDAEQRRIAPRPGPPSPAALARKIGSKASSTDVASPGPHTSNPAKWGRVDSDGGVFVKTSDGERRVGSWQAGGPAEGLAHFSRRFDDLATEVSILEARLDSHPDEARKTRATAQTLAEGLVTASVVGDLDSLAKRLANVVSRSESVDEESRERRQAERTAAVERKETLASEAEEIGRTSTQWKASGDRLRDILEEWKTIKGIERKVDDALWKRFSKAREAFNRRRGSHFAELDRNRATSREQKESLVQRAEAIQHSTDWTDTAVAFRTLMDEWKAAGRAPRDSDNALWARFKAAQDAFFDARHAALSERDAEFEANAVAKDALLSEFDGKIDQASDLSGARAALRSLHERWEAIGKVPRDRMGDLEGRIRALEKRVNDAADTEWRRSDPEVKARAAQFWSRVHDFEEQAAKAESAGKSKDAAKAREQASQWREWAQAAEKAVDSR